MRIGLSITHHVKHLALLGGALLFVGVSVALVDRALAQAAQDVPVAASGEHVLSIHDRGEQRVVITKARTLR